MPTRDVLAEIARTTLVACDAGAYDNARGERVPIAADLERARSGSVLHELGESLDPPEKRALHTIVTVTGESTLEALARLDREPGGHVACLNFASARRAGGGFLAGAQAQEESLARSSALYPCLLEHPSHYERNLARGDASALYLDLAIFSPHVPFFRDDAGGWLDRAVRASVITCAAPNAGALRQHGRFDEKVVAETLARRGAFVLAVAAHHRVARLVLGAWGAGVFANDPLTVARAFATSLTLGGAPFAGVFDEVVFAVLDRARNGATYRAFADTFGA